MSQIPIGYCSMCHVANSGLLFSMLQSSDQLFSHVPCHKLFISFLCDVSVNIILHLRKHHHNISASQRCKLSKFISSVLSGWLGRLAVYKQEGIDKRGVVAIIHGLLPNDRLSSAVIC